MSRHLQSVFTLGIPGSGKTSVLLRRFTCQQITILDLDEEIKKHPLYNPDDRAAVYQNKDAYDWANICVQKRYESLLTSQFSLVAIDGTGTHISRQRDRIAMAKSHGYHTTLLHVHLPLDIAHYRNSRRQRVVPRDVMEDYHSHIEEAVMALKDDVDEYIYDDNSEDDSQSLREKWGNMWWLHLKTAPATAAKARLLYERIHGSLKASS